VNIISLTTTDTITTTTDYSLSSVLHTTTTSIDTTATTNTVFTINLYCYKQVRTAAAFAVTKVGALMGVTGVLTRIIPCLQQLVIDGCEHVRAALASVICELAPLLGQVNKRSINGYVGRHFFF
jgi:hypothetical protein